MDGVSDRDYLLEYPAALSIIMMHLEPVLRGDWLLWNPTSTSLWRSTTLQYKSSIMLQKKKPDIAELGNRMAR